MAFDQNFTSGFNPVLFIYLNPSLNLSSIEDAFTYVQNNNNNNFLSNIDIIPSGIDPLVFISENRSQLDISTLNSNIKQSMILNGEGLDNGVYFPTLYRSCINIDSNVFRINKPGEPSMYFSSCNLNIGDEVKLVKHTGQNLYGVITNIIDNQTFKIDFSGCLQINDQSSEYNYNLYGIKLYDPFRLVCINYLRLYGQVTPCNLVNIDENFNYELYQVLYPDSRNLNKEEAFVDYTNRKGNDELRIINVDDFSTSNVGQGTVFTGSQVAVSALEVKQHLVLSFTQETGRVTWNNQDIYYVTNDICRPLYTVSPTFPGLITEYAMKNYLYNMFYPLATFSNIQITGITNATTVLCSNLTVSEEAGFNNAIINNNLLGGRIGIGITPSQQQYPILPTSNAEFANVTVNQSLFIGNATKIMGHLYGATANFSSIQGGKYGVGPSLSNSNFEFPSIAKLNCDILQVGKNFAASNNTIVATFNGIVIANNVSVVSDKKLKKNIYEYNSSKCDLPNVVSFSYLNQNKRCLGFIAQDLETDFPESVVQSQNYRMTFDIPKTFRCKMITNELCELYTDEDEEYNLGTDDFVIIADKIIKIQEKGKDSCIIKYYSSTNKILVSGFLYGHIKLVDYSQILMILVDQVKDLKSKIQQMTVSRL